MVMVLLGVDESDARTRRCSGTRRYSSFVATQLERRTETRLAIVDAALSLFLEADGIDASIDAVAERAGVAKSTVIYHFRSGYYDQQRLRQSVRSRSRAAPAAVPRAKWMSPPPSTS
jgi:AcrR family transcriptional regulator